jgi:protein-L-isoaspartate O-methyltransferase
MSTMWSRKTLQNELDKRDKYPSGARGQHFMTDSTYLSHIVDQAGVENGDVVLEIGTGPGHLTTTLLEEGCYVIGVEIDETLAELCRAQTGNPDELSLFHCLQPSVPAGHEHSHLTSGKSGSVQ